MPTIKGKIESVTFVKSGPRKDGKGNYSMFKVKIAGQEFTGFGDSWQRDINKEGDYEYIEKPWTDRSGNAHVDKTLTGPKRGGFNPQQLQSIENKLDEVLAILKQDQQPSIEDSSQNESEINVDDIPF